MRKDFVYTENILTPEECNLIRTICIDKQVEFMDIHPAGKNCNVYRAPARSFPIEIVNKFFHAVNYLNNTHFGFDLYNFQDTISGFTLNEYVPGHEYPFHQDGDTSFASDIKLTAIINLTTVPYEGGEFEFFEPCLKLQKFTEVKQPGSLLLFQSHILHRVKPVTKGVRYSLSYWFSGPKLK